MVLCCKCLFSFYFSESLKWCYNKKSANEKDYFERIQYHYCAIMVFFVSVLLIISLACIVFSPKMSLNMAMSSEISSLADMKQVFNTAGNSATSIAQSLTAFNSSVNVVACRNALKAVQKYATVEGYVSTSQNDITQVSNLIFNQLTPKVEFIQSYVNESTSNNTNVAFWVYWAGIVFWAFILLMIFFCRSKCLLTFTMVTTEFFIVVFAVISSALLLVVHILADVCLDPAQTVRTVVHEMASSSSSGEQQDIAKIATYYTSCNGKSVLLTLIAVYLLYVVY